MRQLTLVMRRLMTMEHHLIQMMTSSSWSYNVNDGSDIVVLGESYYSNPGTFRDAIGAEDALGALRISVDAAGHSTSQIIAATLM